MKLFVRTKIWYSAGLVALGIITALFFFNCQPAWKLQTSQVPQVVGSIPSDIKTFNYALSESEPSIFALTYEGLVKENPITAEIEPDLAESWNFSEDKLRIVFTLRTGLRWSDGKPLTTEDVVFTYNQIYLNKKIPTVVRDSFLIGETRTLPKVKRLNDLQVEFTISEPFAPFLSRTSAAILPAHALRASVETNNKEGKSNFLYTWGTDTPPAQVVVNGSYLLESYIPSQRIIFRRNPYYWKKDGQGNQQPYIERVIWVVIESKDTALLQFRSKGLDYIEVWPEYFSLLKREEKRGNFTIYNGGPQYRILFMAFNLNKGKREGKPLVEPYKSRWFNNIRFRKAVAYAIDRQKIVNNIYRGLGQVQNSQICMQSPYYLPSEASLEYKYNPQYAKELLLEAEFRYDDKGKLLDRDGHVVRFTLFTDAGNISTESIGVQIKQDLNQIGIQVDFQPIAYTALVDKLINSLEWEAHIISFTGSNEPHAAALWYPEGNFHLFNKKPQVSQQPLEDREVADWEERIGQLYIKAARELDRGKRRVIYAEAQQIIREYLPLIFLTTPYSLTAVRNRIQGVQYSALEGALWNIDDLRITSNW